MRRYADFFTSFRTDPFWEGKAAPIVLTFTPDAKRAERLLKTTVKAGGRSAYWFATFSCLFPDPPAPPKRDPSLPKFAPNPVWLSPVSFFDHRFLVPHDANGRTLADKFRL